MVDATGETPAGCDRRSWVVSIVAAWVGRALERAGARHENGAERGLDEAEADRT